MDGDTEIIENETGETNTSKIEVMDSRGEKADLIQEKEFKSRLESDKVEEKLIQFETFLGKYTKQKVSEGIKVNLVSGKFGSGEVVGGVLSVNLPNSSEIIAESNDPNAEDFLKVLTDAGTTYKEIAMISASSTILHESEHMLIDSRPGSQLALDFENAQPPERKIILDEEGHILSLLDEGITYAYQLEKDSENQLIQRLESKKPQGNESVTVKMRKELGEKLRPKLKEYVDGGKQIDSEFLAFAGEEVRKLDIDNYVVQARMEKDSRSRESLVVVATEKIIQEPIPLITEKEVIPPSGDKRDFVSLTPYWYRNENGQLEVRDGEINPETKKYHDSENLAKVENNIFLTALATREVENEDKKKRFAQYALTNIKYWFVNETTRMTPSLEFAQMKQGDETGNFFGIIEGTGLEYVTQGADILKEQGLIDDETYEGVKTWFKEYLNWLQTSEKAVGNPNSTNEKERAGEKGMPNNHGTFYDVQVAYIADFLGDRETVLKTLDSAKVRIENQITPEGEMPEESNRGGGSAMSYEMFNLEAFAKLAILGKKYDVDLWKEERLQKAFNYFVEKLKNAGDKPFKFDRKGAIFLSFRAAAEAYNNQEYWDLPTKYYSDPMVEEMTVKMFKKPEAV